MGKTDEVMEMFAEAQGEVIPEPKRVEQLEALSDLPPPFGKVVALRRVTNGRKIGAFQVQSTIAPIPSIFVDCPRGCGQQLKLKAGYTLEALMGGHSCPNAVGHKAYIAERRLVAEQRKLGWELGRIVSIDTSRNEMTVGLEGRIVTILGTANFRVGVRVWVRGEHEGQRGPSLWEKWEVQPADKR